MRGEGVRGGRSGRREWRGSGRREEWKEGEGERREEWKEGGGEKREEWSGGGERRREEWGRGGISVLEPNW